MTGTTTSVTVTSVNQLVGVQSAMYVRPITLTVTVNGARPNTPMNVFFDTVYVNHFCTGASGTGLTTDANGYLSVTLNVPGGRFTTGTKEIVVTDTTELANLTLIGSTFGSARTQFVSTGIDKFFQNTTTKTTQDIVTVDQYLPPPDPLPPSVGGDGGYGESVAGDSGDGGGDGDPLAQSFFTYGKSGGVFLTSIDLFFNSKDTSTPIKLEIRDMVNGYPSSIPTSDLSRIVYMNPSQVNTSTNSSVPTNFKFKYPVYLSQDKDYCFVISGNSNNYNVFTSKLGEPSIETGKIIFDQPYVGSMFKSSNNSTWTAEQFEDVKFKLYIAQFDTSSSANLTMSATAQAFAVPGINFTTTSGSTTVTYTQPQKHGLEINSRIDIVADTGATYNGIPAANIAGSRAVTSIVDEYTVQFAAASAATSTGAIQTGGQVKHIMITNGGSGYTSAPSVAFSSGSATATASIFNGAVVGVTITNPGSGYTGQPDVTFSGGNGTNAAATALIDAMFSVTANKPTNYVIPNLPYYAATGTNIAASVTTTQLNYVDGNLNTYTPAETLNMALGGKTALTINALVASASNETTKMSGNKSMLINYNMSSDNANVSPVLDMRNSPSITSYNYRINNQVGETIGDVTNTELTPTAGTAQSRYLTVKTGITTPSKGVLLTASIYSTQGSSVEWYIRTSLAGSGVVHEQLSWRLLNCDVDRNKSSKANDFWDYQFYLYDVPTFDTYDLKCVLRSSDPNKAPIVNNYRVIVTA